MIDLTIIPHEVKVIAEKAGTWTQQVETDLNSNVIKAAAAYVPEGEAAREAVIAILDTVIAGCKALAAIADNTGIKGRLQRAGSDITRLQHNSDHSITHYIIWFEVVFNDLFGGDPAPAVSATAGDQPQP